MSSNMVNVGNSVITIVDQLIAQAIATGASDIHLEANKDRLRVRYRLDGLLYDQEAIKSEIMHQIISRIKVLANIDIAQQRIPQDGKFYQEHEGERIDLRVSTFPTLFGQKVVIRILRQEKKVIALDNLGMTDVLKTNVAKLLKHPQGFFLVTGPTGSGKTTTLYAGLCMLNSPEKNIITLEDPIEYHIPGVTQGHIHPEVGFTFEKGMRHLLRQDPDVVMIGEIRDAQTAAIAIQAAMTGHLVVSTVHTNDAPSVIMRLMDMGIAPYLINASLSGVLAQRLVRRLCMQCKIVQPITADQQKLLDRFDIQLAHMYASVGCEACFGTGYKGRVGIFELLCMNAQTRALISQQPSVDALRKQAEQDGMRSLLYDGLCKLQAGVISFDELVRIV